MNEIKGFMFETKIERLDDTAVVRAFGEVDVATAPALASALQGASEPTVRRLVVDLTMVTLLDSSGLGVLITHLNKLQGRSTEADGADAQVEAVPTESGGGATEMRLVVPERILKVFSVTGLNAVFPIFPTMEEALDSPG
jgi:anti-sigma B factor antagonist